MKSVAYVSPFVPPEWIAAHAVQPQWLRLGQRDGRSSGGVRRGVCPYAGALLEAVQSGLDVAAVVVTTACDQMRYAAAAMELEGTLPVFVFNLPSTWQTEAAQRLYRDELQRLGRFLVGLGGESPPPDRLIGLMLRYDAARATALDAQGRVSARRFAALLAEVRDSGELPRDETAAALPAPGIPLALLGGPLTENDYTILDRLEQAGARVVLDGTETGQRTLPARFDRGRLQTDPLAELARAYFGSIPDVFRRPNHGLFDWLRREMAARQVRGLLLRRYVWCDLWHAELARLRQSSPVPVLEIDVNDDDGSALARTLGRWEAFLEMLR